MKNSVFLTIAALCVCSVCTAEETATAVTRPKLSREEMKAKLHQASLKGFGGYINKPDSAVGSVAIINAQKRVDEAEIRRAMAVIDKGVYVQTQLTNVNSVALESISSLIAKTGSKLGVAVVEMEDFPALLHAPEAGWSVVNVTALATDNPKPETLAMRVRKELLRGFGLSTGCGNTLRGPIVMCEVNDLADLDSISREMYGPDAVAAIRAYLPKRGIKPWYRTTYRKACQEGWAPQPTNEYQKAIWDKVHAIPTKPIKIEFDPKIDKK